MDVHRPRPQPAFAALLCAVIVLGAAIFIVVPGWQLVELGPFHWHLEQDSTWQGGIEAVVLIGLVAAGFAQNSRIALALLVTLPAVFYLRRHAVDVPLLIDVVYIESVFALGALARRCCGIAPAEDTLGYLHNFIFGFCAWSASAWALSAGGLGSVIDLRWLALVLAVIGFAARPRPFAVHLWSGLQAATLPVRALCGALIGWGLVLIARGGFVSGYDSLWYGLRPQYVLVADGSVFKPLGLVSPVHYFPKLYELFLTPLAGLGNQAVMLGIGVGVLLLIGLVCRQLLSELGLRESWRWLGVALCVTMPAVANTALEAKPDSLALLLVMLALVEAIRFLRRPELAHLVWFATCALLATQAKLTAIPYVGVLAIALMLIVWRQRRADAPIPKIAIDRTQTRFAVAALGFALVTAAFVTARTWLLAGMPTIGPDPLVTLWHAFGLQFIAPAGTLNWTRAQIWSDVPALLMDEFFRPQVLPHIVVTWLGNVWLYLGLVALLASIAANARRTLRDRAVWLGFALVVTGVLLLVGWRYTVRGSDGNYFAVAAVTAVAFALVAALRRLEHAASARRMLAVSLIAFASFQAAYTFASGAWTPGTRAFDVDMSRGLHANRKATWQVLERAGIAQIADRLRQGANVRRVVGYVPDSVGFRLPLRYEDLTMVGYSRPEYLASAPALLAFLRANRIDAIIVPRDGAPADVRALAQPLLAPLPQLEEQPGVRYFDDRNYRLLDFSASLPANP